MDIQSLNWIIPVIVFVAIGGSLLLMAVIFIPFIVRMVKNSQMTGQVMKTGVDATATILTTWDTGVRINDNPQVGMRLQVQPPNGAAYQADVTKTVSIVQIGMFQPGMQLMVKYDPANPRNVAIVSVVPMGMAGMQMAGMMGGAPMGAPAGATGGMNPNAGGMNPQQVEQMLFQYQAANEQIVKIGTQAVARVLQYMPMGINVNGNNPVVNLMLEVQPAGSAAFTSQAQGIVVSETSVPKYQPGQMITVRYNPSDMTRVAVEHSGV